MYCDLISTKKTPELESMAQELDLILFPIEEFKVVDGINDSVIRDALESKNVDIVLNPHQARKKDALHSRNSGLNQVLCALASKNKVAIAVSLDYCYEAQDLGRVMQNIILCRKAKIPFLFVSLAKNLYELRNPRDIISFGLILGMSTQEATRSVSVLGEIFKKKRY